MIAAVIIGNLGKDAELRHLEGGNKVCGFRVACRTSFKKEDPATWVSVSYWGERAERIVTHLKKGSKVIVRGSLSQRAWSSNGKSGVDLELRADDIEFASPRPEDSGASSGAPAVVGTNYPASWDMGGL